MISEKASKKEGFTLIESLIALGILAVLTSLAIISFRYFNQGSVLEGNVQEIINMSRYARNRTIASEDASQYGIYFSDTVSPNEYIVFKGPDFSSRDVSYDQVHRLPDSLEFSGIDLDGGKEFVFARISGEAIPSGHIKVRLKNDVSREKTIYVKSSGQVDLNAPIVPAMTNLIKDSRHVDFDLGWGMQNAVSLKFFFPGAVQTETVNMASYFNIDKTEFDWSGSFSVAGKEQIFRVHTHLLDSFVYPFTRLCVHRDRNSGGNDQEVIIYINDGGVDKEIVHYLNDENATAVQGPFVAEMEVQ